MVQAVGSNMIWEFIDQTQNGYLEITFPWTPVPFTKIYPQNWVYGNNFDSAGFTAAVDAAVNAGLPPGHSRVYVYVTTNVPWPEVDFDNGVRFRLKLQLDPALGDVKHEMRTTISQTSFDPNATPETYSLETSYPGRRQCVLPDPCLENNGGCDALLGVTSGAMCTAYDVFSLLDSPLGFKLDPAVDCECDYELGFYRNADGQCEAGSFDDVA